MARPIAYYYVFKERRWILFAIRTAKDLTLCFPLQTHPLCGLENEEHVRLIKGYWMDRADVQGLKFLALKRITLFVHRGKSAVKKAINKYFQRVSEWRTKLLNFLVSIDVQSEFTEIVRSAERISGTSNLVIGLFARPAECFLFELKQKGLSYEERVILISKEEHTKTFDKLYNIEGSTDFTMPSKFGKINYKAYQLVHRGSFLGIVLFDKDNLSDLGPYVQIDDFMKVLANLLVVVRSSRLYYGRQVLSRLFESDEPDSVSTLNSRVKRFMNGKRLRWIDQACGLIAKNVNVDACTVFWRHSEDRLVLAGSTHCRKLEYAFYNLNQRSLTTRCFKSDQPLCLSDVGASKENSHIFDEDIGTQHKSWLGYPIRAKGTRIGVLRLLHKRTPSGQMTCFCGSDIENAQLASNYLAKCYEELTQYAKMYKARSEAEKLQKQAQIAERTISRFMKSLTHEIQRPIPSVGGLLEYLEMLLSKSSVSEKDHLLLKIKDCYSCLDLLQVILDTIANQSGRIILDFDEINLVEDLLVPLKKMLLPAARDEKKGFTWDDHTSREWVTLDKALTTQILVILLLNAFKYADDNTEVILTVSDTPDGIEFEVEDVGEVIPESCVDQIFKWEFRAPAIVKKRYPGAGIGLSLAQDIAKALGTTILVKKLKPKTVFAFKLKLGGQL